jgi:hypothetical protein
MKLLTVRYGLPLGLFLLGIVFLVIEPNTTGLDGFCAATGAALALLLLNVLFRTGVAGDRDREREEAAREYFDRYGRWPDQDDPETRRRRRAEVRGEPASSPAPESEPEPARTPRAEPSVPRPLVDATRPTADPGSPNREPRREGGRLTRPRPSRRP